MKNIWFTSDPHFGHKNIIKYCNRPFSSVEEMDEILIQNWNSKVREGDTVYCLGDFTFGDPLPYLKRLNGYGGLHLIYGNHDNKKKHEAASKWNWMKDLHYLNVNGQAIILAHYAHRVWEDMHKGSWHLHGHSHCTLPPYGKSFDVGVDCWGYTPVSFEQVRERMNQQELVKGIGED